MADRINRVNSDNIAPHYSDNSTQMHSLNQGTQFKKNKKNTLENKNKNKNKTKGGKEGFTDSTTSSSMTASTDEVITTNTITAAEEAHLQELQLQYDATLAQYNDLMIVINATNDAYLSRVNNNPYLGKIIRFSTNHICYVTMQGLVKYIPSMEIWANASPSGYNYTNVNIPWLDSYWTYGTPIGNLNLISGTNLGMQSIGNEGSNIFVNALVNNPKETYKGCYRDLPAITEIMFIPVMTSNNVSGFIASASSVYQNNDGYGPSKAFDGNVNTFWHSQAEGWGPYDRYTGEYKGDHIESAVDTNGENVRIAGEWIRIHVLNTNGKHGTPLTKYDVQGRQGCCGNPSGRSPNSWVIIGWDGFTWRVIDKQVNQALNFEMRSYNITNPISCSDYQFITTNCGNPGDHTGTRYCVQISIWNLYTTNEASFTNSQRAMTYDTTKVDRADLETCKSYALLNGYQYFGLQDGETQTPACLVSNSLARSQMYGEGFNYRTSVLWAVNVQGGGNTAMLNNQGSLLVINSAGASVWNSPAQVVTDYMGSYGDSNNRAMQLLNNGSQTFNYDSCKAAAIQGGHKYFALQNSSTGQNAQCGVSNDVSSVTKYGARSSYTNVSNEVKSGGGWTNSVYNTQSDIASFLILQDDGNCVIYKGASPNDNQGVIWATGTQGRQTQPNPNFTAEKGKFRQNWMPNGSVLASNEFLGSNDGSIYLIMQTDGNLVLYTSEKSLACTTNSSGQTVGGSYVNALYEVQQSFKDNIGKLAYIDENSALHEYPSDNSKLAANYTKMANVDSYGNDIPGAVFSGATVESCTSTCNNNPDCYGFVFDNRYSNCWPKTSSVYPYGGPTIPLQGLDLYTRNKIPSIVPNGVSSETKNIDSVQYQFYLNGGPLSSSYGLANATEQQQKELEALQAELNSLSSQINELTIKYGVGQSEATAQSTTNLNDTNTSSTEYTDTTNTVTTATNPPPPSGTVTDETANQQNAEGFTGNNDFAGIERIAKDSDIYVLQKNFEYLFWSILAAGSVIVAMNIAKKNK